MKVIVKKDSTDIFITLFKGSILNDVEEKGEKYCGVFSSLIGTYYIEVPKKRCREYKKPFVGRIPKRFKGLVCKTSIRRFESDFDLKK
jgi:hypothetical protein